MIAEMVFKVMLVLGDKLATRTLQKFLVFNVRSGMLPKVILKIDQYKTSFIEVHIKISCLFENFENQKFLCSKKCDF